MPYSLELGLSVVAGVASHLGYFIQGEYHIKAPWIVGFHALLFLGGILFESRVLHRQLQDALVATLSVAGAYAGALYTSMLIYRAFFHRLKNFPGPPLAKLSKFYHAYKVRNYQQCKWLHELHKQYGDFVRTGPSEITIFTPDAIPHILGSQTRCKKSMWWEMMWPEVSMVTTRDKEMHDSRRRAWDHGFSISALRAQEPHLNGYVDQLIALIASHNEKPLDFTETFGFFAFDVMGDINFGFKFDCMKNNKQDWWLATFREAMFLFGPFTPLPWLFHILTSIPGAQRDWIAFKAWSDGLLRKRLQEKPTKPDMMSHAIAHAEREDGGPEKRYHWLLSDTITLILAASEPVISTAVYLVYHMARNPEFITTLRKELSSVDDVKDHRQLQNLTYLNALINETLRLHPSVPSGGLRDTPPEGITVGNTYIPGNTIVLIPHYSLGRREDCYEKPYDFIPERWYSKPEMIKNRDAYIPFSTGDHTCLGNNLAKMEIRLAVARLVSRFDFGFAPGENGTDTHAKMLDLFTTTPGPLRLVFRERDILS